jgi:hypothetical protein
MTWNRGSAAWAPHSNGWVAVEIVFIEGDEATVRLVLLPLGGIPSRAAKRSVPLRDLVFRDVTRAGNDKPRSNVRGLLRHRPPPKDRRRVA